MMKRITAFALVLVFVLTACAVAFADYYPTVKFASSSKNKYVRYGDRYTLRVKCKQGTGPFGKTTSLFHKPILRAGLTVVASKGNNKNKLVDWDFYGDTTYKKRFWTDEEFPDPVFNYGNGDLQVTHELLLNCAASSVEVDAHVVDNEIVINYLVDDNISANCMCPKTLEYTLHNVPRGTYTIIITIEETELYHHTVTL